MASSTVVLPQGTYAIGTRVLGPATVPLGLTSVELVLDGAAMTDPALQVTLVIDLSLDGGVTWNSPHPDVDPFPIGATFVGGATNEHGGGPLDFYRRGVDFPQPTNAARQIKATITIAGTPLTTKGTLNLT
jgi:hypothetical protein